MSQIKSILERARPLAVAVTFGAAAIVSMLPAHIVGAEALTARSLMVTSTSPSDQTTDGAGVNVGAIGGHPNNGSKVGHTYTFTAGTAGTVKGITFQVCSTPFGYTGSCTTPNAFTSANLPNASVVVGALPGTPVTFTGASTAANAWKVTNSTGVAVTAGQVIHVTFTATNSLYFVNPSTAYYGTDAWGTYFVHAITYSSDTTLTAPNQLDEGTVTNSITNQISITTKVQETLKFSVEGDNAENGVSVAAGSTCAALNPGGSLNALTLGDSQNVLSTTTQYDTRSYFRLATNSASGAIVYYSGDTLKSGSNDINALSTATTPSIGNEQFGLTLDSTATDYSLTQLAATTDYNSATAFTFKTASFTTPVSIATSSGIVSCDTGAIRYVANIADQTPAGIYTTKITYIASPSY